MTGRPDRGDPPPRPWRRARWAPGQTWRPERFDEPERVGGPDGGPLDAVARRLGVAKAQGLAALYDRWDEVVGEAAAAHASPGGLRAGRLAIDVDHPAWAASLGHLERAILDRIAEVAGPGVVDGIDLRVRPRG